jgi:hypothetical protein
LYCSIHAVQAQRGVAGPQVSALDCCRHDAFCLRVALHFLRHPTPGQNLRHRRSGQRRDRAHKHFGRLPAGSARELFRVSFYCFCPVFQWSGRPAARTLAAPGSDTLVVCGLPYVVCGRGNVPGALARSARSNNFALCEFDDIDAIWSSRRLRCRFCLSKFRRRLGLLRENSRSLVSAPFLPARGRSHGWRRRPRRTQVRCVDLEPGVESLPFL